MIHGFTSNLVRSNGSEERSNKRLRRHPNGNIEAENPRVSIKQGQKEDVTPDLPGISSDFNKDNYEDEQTTMEIPDLNDDATLNDFITSENRRTFIKKG
ncbi:unnamed protein product [Hymenolepis diminuta]|uniref:Uncharacterized protein n=1 Tax=Hymenolepis diminuta TaxID=6216 RepID=A0A0R3SAZ3_HYMDI|nr:unnamed protein product [Hymenolepis diminuta]